MRRFVDILPHKKSLALQDAIYFYAFGRSIGLSRNDDKRYLFLATLALPGELKFMSEVPRTPTWNKVDRLKFDYD